MKKYRNLISYAVILILAGLFVALLFSGQKKDTLRYSDVIGYFRDGMRKTVGGGGTGYSAADCCFYFKAAGGSGGLDGRKCVRTLCGSRRYL